jgi:TrwC relaxase.
MCANPYAKMGYVYGLGGVMSARVAKLTTKRAIGLMGNHIANDGPKYSHSPELDVERPAILGVTADTEVNPRYLQRAGIPLEWVGAAAADLGLSGIAGEKMTAKVLQHGLGPQGQALRTAEVADNDQQRVLAYSVVYAAPKSISLLIAADHPQVRKAAHQALRAASEAYISALEQQLTVRRGKAGVRSERIPGLVAVRAIHQTSSTGDPHIHTHWLILSSAPSEADGAWRALDGRAFFQAQKLAESSANAALRQSLRASLGISDWTLVESGSCPAWEISGLLDQDGNLSTARQHLQQIADQLDVPFALRSRKMDERLWRQHREQKKPLPSRSSTNSMRRCTRAATRPLLSAVSGRTKWPMPDCWRLCNPSSPVPTLLRLRPPWILVTCHKKPGPRQTRSIRRVRPCSPWI